ncbi:unnamed protein product [Pylaiella littoralis]
MAALGATVPDTPEDVTIQLQRTAFLSSKVVDRVSDEIDDDVRGIDEADLKNVSVTISPAMSPTGQRLQRASCD